MLAMTSLMPVGLVSTARLGMCRNLEYPRVSSEMLIGGRPVEPDDGVDVVPTGYAVDSSVSLGASAW